MYTYKDWRKIKDGEILKITGDSFVEDGTYQVIKSYPEILVWGRPNKTMGGGCVDLWGLELGKTFKAVKGKKKDIKYRVIKGKKRVIDGYNFYIIVTKRGSERRYYIKAGCRFFSPKQAKIHWSCSPEWWGELNSSYRALRVLKNEWSLKEVDRLAQEAKRVRL